MASSRMLGSIRDFLMGARRRIGMLLGSWMQDPPERSTEDMERLYGRSPFIHATLSKVATAAAMCRIRLYAHRRNGRFVDNAALRVLGFEARDEALRKLMAADEIVELDDHPMLSLLMGGNTIFVGFTLRQLTQIHLDLTGEAFWWLERDRLGVPRNAWPLPPHAVETPRAGKSYRVSLLGGVFEVEPADMIHFHIPDPADPYARGSGAVAAASNEADIDEFTARHLRSFYFNRARPDVIMMSDDLTREQTERLEKRWLETGSSRFVQYRPFFINRKLDIHQLGQTFESMQLMDMRRFERELFQHLFGIPPEILGSVPTSSRNLSSADHMFSRFVLLPRLEFQRQVLQRHLAPQYDERIIVHFDSPVRDDREFQMRAAQAMPWTIKVDEWRQWQGLPPLGPPEGERFIVTNRVSVYDSAPGGVLEK